MNTNQVYGLLRPHGFVDVAIAEQFIPLTKFSGAEAGVWYVLSARRPGQPFEVIGRRRTHEELLKLARRGPVELRNVRAAR